VQMQTLDIVSTLPIMYNQIYSSSGVALCENCYTHSMYLI
jgi:hypothetical protein